MVSTRSSGIMLLVPAAFASNGTLSVSRSGSKTILATSRNSSKPVKPSAHLCGGLPVVDATADWVWSREVLQSPSCTWPEMENPAKMCAGDPTSVVIEGTGQPQCASSWMQDCKFSMRDLTQLDFDVSMLQCGGTWTAPLWMTPDYWAGGGSSGEIDMSENCPAESLWSNFAGGGVEKRWDIANPNDFQGHTTLYKLADGDGVLSIRVQTCTEKQAAVAGGSCPLTEDHAYLRDIYGQNGCRDGNCIYTMVSDIWNGWAGDEGFYSCANGEPKLGNKCKVSVKNIRIRGVPFTGNCRRLLEWPVPAGALTSVGLRASAHCMGASGNADRNGVSVQVRSCDRHTPMAAQRWLYREGQVIHRGANGEEFCLNVPGNKQFNGRTLNLWKCNGRPQQQFVYKNGAIETRGGAKCVDVRAEDGLTLQLWDCLPEASGQQWHVAEVLAPSEAVAVTSYKNAACLDLTASNAMDGIKVQVAPCDPVFASDAQQWRFQDGQIVHTASKGKELCLDVPSNSLKNGQRLQLWSCTGAPQQRFKYQGGMIKTVDGSKCLDVREEDGRAVHLWDCNSLLASQHWLITAVATAVLV